MTNNTNKEENPKSLPDVSNGIENITPYADPVDFNLLLIEIEIVIKRVIVCDDETVVVAVLWITMTWFIDVIQVAPLAVITAPEKRCGKSQLLALFNRLVNRPILAANITPAALFRVMEKWSPTLLIDEADTFMRNNEQLRGILNCGHTRDQAFVIRTVIVKGNHEPCKFNVWGAKALAGIGILADTLMDRSVILRLRRKLSHEHVERLLHLEPECFKTLKSKLARIAFDYKEIVRQARPPLPDVLNDRAQDNWEPLLAIAEAAGGKWFQRATAVAIKLALQEDVSLSLGTELLSDIKNIFEHKGVERIGTADLIKALCKDEEQPWATYNRGNQITARQLATLLKGYGIKSKSTRLNSKENLKGFSHVQFNEAFSSYLPNAVTSVTAPQFNPNKDPVVADNSSGVDLAVTSI